MQNNTKYLGYIVFICGISVSSSAAFYSIFGLGKLFGGASTQIMIMATTLEVSKLVIAAALHRHWQSIKLLLKTYLISATIILVGITSAGIYGFLSSAYQQTKAYDDEIQSNIEIVKSELTILTNDLDTKQKEKDKVVEQINLLRESLGKNVQQTVDRKTGQLIITTSGSNRKSYESQIQYAMESNKRLDDEIGHIRDSVISKKGAIVKLEASSNKNSELGPLKYISGLTHTDMDVVVNYFILILIIVFDPLAVVLLILSQHILTLKAPFNIIDKFPDNTISNGTDKKISETPILDSQKDSRVVSKSGSIVYPKNEDGSFVIKKSNEKIFPDSEPKHLNNYSTESVVSPAWIQVGDNVNVLNNNNKDIVHSTYTDNSTIEQYTDSTIEQYNNSTEKEKPAKFSDESVHDSLTNSDIIISGNALPKTLSDKLKAFLSGEKKSESSQLEVEKQKIDLSPSQRRIFTDKEIQEYYNKENNNKI